MPSVSGYSHLSLTVSDVDRSFEWYERVLGIQRLFDGEESGVTYIVSVVPGTNAILGFRRHGTTQEDVFDESRIGLDHFAFQVGARSDLEEWEARLDELSVEHSEIKDVDYGSVLTFRDPDNIQVEFFTLPG